MLTNTELFKTASVERLVRAWSQLYRLNLAALSSPEAPSLQQWTEADSVAGRAITAAKLNEQLLSLKCQMAGIQTSDLYTYMPNVMDCNELKQLADISLRIYQALLDVYQRQSLDVAVVLYKLSSGGSPANWATSTWGIPDLEQMITVLQPLLLEFQNHHRAAQDWRAMGFLTTQLNFCNYWLLQTLTPLEQQLITPYLKFVEEYLAHPWQRVCGAGHSYSANSPALKLVEQMIPVAPEISQRVYAQLLNDLPNHISRRGTLDHPGVKHSCLRDLNMFQAYLWLCVLEQKIEPIEHELLPLCLMVLPSVGVKWELVELWIQTLTCELINRIELSQRSLVLPYSVSLYQTFANSYRDGIPPTSYLQGRNHAN